MRTIIWHTTVIVLALSILAGCATTPPPAEAVLAHDTSDQVHLDRIDEALVYGESQEAFERLFHRVQYQLMSPEQADFIQARVAEWPDQNRALPSSWFRARSAPLRPALVRTLNLRGWSEERLLAWWETPAFQAVLPHLTILNLRGSLLGIQGYLALAENLRLSRVTHLYLGETTAGDAELGVLAAVEDLPLQELHLDGNPISDAGLVANFDSSLFSSLRVLNLSRTEVTASGLSEFLTGRMTETLEALLLSGIALGRDKGGDPAPLTDIKPLPGLRVLDLQSTGLTDADLQILAEAPLLRSVEVLRLSGNHIGRGVALLLESGEMHHLTTLSFDEVLEAEVIEELVHASSFSFLRVLAVDVADEEAALELLSADLSSLEVLCIADVVIFDRRKRNCDPLPGNCQHSTDPRQPLHGFPID